MESLRLRKFKFKANIISLVLIMAVTAFILAVPDVSADNGNEKQKQEVIDMCQGVLSIVVGTIDPSLITNAETEDSSNKIFSGFYAQLVNGSAPDGGDGGAAITGFSGMSMFKKVVESFKAIGCVFVIIVAASRYMEAMSKGQDMVEVLYRLIADVCISIMIIMYSDQILNLLSAVGQLIIKVTCTPFIGTFGGENSDNMDQVATDVLKGLTGKESGGFGWRIQVAVALIIPKAMALLVKVAAKFVILQVLLEIAIRQVLTPLFIADVYSEGLRSPGMRHLKLYLACFIKIAIYVLIGLLCQPLIQSVANTEGASVDQSHPLLLVLDIIAINFTAVGTMMKAGEYVNTFAN